ncbi:substrate-binding domain-containing protein [Acidipila sp. EB88]|uniref:substrate-binding domain-containing protein n=1 Tax=Acidipila sp. EB88 TaxID=2305226 RepID=UPI000F5E24C0|nr:substrate-binding domain-containing protein [Acidipila sp. EB88]RRA47599.1 hypothetical protein D1Y84_04130 [Acidipila sp. EB88]
MAVYRSGPANSGQPFLALPEDVNLSRQNVRSEHPEISLALNDKTFYPEPLVFYAACLKQAANPKGASDFLALLRGDEGQRILRGHGFYAPGDATPLHA